MEPYLKASVLGRAIREKKIGVNFYNPRDFLNNKNERVDGKPFGGGPGMIIRPEPVIEAVFKAKGRKKNVKIIFLNRKGRKLTNDYASSLLSQNYKHIIIVSGRYEGIDARVYNVFKDEDTDHLSLGTFILTGGEIPALAVVDCVSRQVKGVLGDYNSLEERRTAGRMVYTRPATFKYKGKSYSVPSVLVSGHHSKIENWKKRNK
jgi:tRNA (guanine37-N1)-methyltransferase